MDLRSRIPKLLLFAKASGCNRQTAWKVLTGKERPSPQLAIRMEIASLGLIKRWELRPDIWDAPRKKAS